MSKHLFSRETIADFLDTWLRSRLSHAFVISRHEIIDRFDSYVLDNGMANARMFEPSDDSYTFTVHYDRQADFINALVEYATSAYVVPIRNDGYYQLKFTADPLNLGTWAKFIRRVRGEDYTIDINELEKKNMELEEKTMPRTFTQAEARRMHNMLHNVLDEMNETNNSFKAGYCIDDYYEGSRLIDDILYRDEIEKLLKDIDGETQC